MAVKTTLSFTERHHGFLLAKVREGIFATQSAVVAAAVEQMIQDEAEREVALSALADEIRARTRRGRSSWIGNGHFLPRVLRLMLLASGELIQAVTYGGADWMGRTRSRTRPADAGPPSRGEAP